MRGCIVGVFPQNIPLPDALALSYLDRTNEEWRERERELEFHKPEFRESSPFRQFVVELELDHPYWKAYRNELDAPEFDGDYPSVDSFLHKYDEKVNELHTLARNLMQFIAPGAPETGAASAAQTVAPAQTGGAPNAVEELKQYKSLLDAGVITEEEFAAKKRQLLGI